MLWSTVSSPWWSKHYLIKLVRACNIQCANYLFVLHLHPFRGWMCTLSSFFALKSTTLHICTCTLGYSWQFEVSAMCWLYLVSGSSWTRLSFWSDQWASHGAGIRSSTSWEALNRFHGFKLMMTLILSHHIKWWHNAKLNLNWERRWASRPSSARDIVDTGAVGDGQEQWTNQTVWHVPQ